MGLLSGCGHGGVQSNMYIHRFVIVVTSKKTNILLPFVFLFLLNRSWSITFSITLDQCTYFTLGDQIARSVCLDFPFTVE